MKWRDFLIILVLMLSLAISSISFGYSNHQKINKMINIGEEKEIINETQCQNLSLEETADCLTRYVKTFYNYTITDDEDTLTLQELKKKGGDCKNYAELYKKLGEQLGFHSKYVEMRNYGDVGHAITILSDNEGYCILDLKSYHCRRLK